MDNSSKYQMLNDLMNRIKTMNYEQNSTELPEFKSEGEVILSKFFGEKSTHLTKFKDVSFSRTFFLIDETEEDALKDDKEAFETGRTLMISVLKGAIKEIELDEQFLRHSLNEQFSRHAKVEKVVNPINKNKVFIVHGHDEALKTEVARFVEKSGFEAVILHEQANEGRTIIEKIEKHSDVGFAIVLYTPCDEGKSKTSETLNDRARQNVVFEHGYFIAKLDRNNVVALHKGTDIELPNDISGVVYIKYESGAWKYDIAKEMVSSGYNVDFMKI